MISLENQSCRTEVGHTARLRGALVVVAMSAVALAAVPAPPAAPTCVHTAAPSAVAAAPCGEEGKLKGVVLDGALASPDISARIVRRSVPSLQPHAAQGERYARQGWCPAAQAPARPHGSAHRPTKIARAFLFSPLRPSRPAREAAWCMHTQGPTPRRTAEGVHAMLNLPETCMRAAASRPRAQGAQPSGRPE